jgi:hypothetical protein
MVRTILDYSKPEHIIGYATAEQLREYAQYYSRRTTRREDLPPGIDTTIAGDWIRTRRVGELADTSIRESATFGTKEQTYGTKEQTLLEELVPIQELPPYSLPAEMPDTSRRFSWSHDSESIDFVVEHHQGSVEDADTSSFARQDKEEDLTGDIVERLGTPIAELPVEHSPRMYPTLLLDHKSVVPDAAFHAVDASFFEFDNDNEVATRPQHMKESATTLSDDDFDLYSDPSPIHRVTVPTVVETWSRSGTAGTMQRQSGAWSDEYDEWQDAEEWQDTVP